MTKAFLLQSVDTNHNFKLCPDLFFRADFF